MSRLSTLNSSPSSSSSSSSSFLSASSSLSSSSYRRVPLLRQTTATRPRFSTVKRSSSCCAGFSETAGSTTAECAAVMCCFPCGLFEFLALFVYKVPAGLCRRALKKRRREKLIKMGMLLPKRRKCQCGCDGTDTQVHPAVDFGFVKSVEDDTEVMKLEMEMWERFYGTGFWRSPSQREIDNVVVVDTKIYV